MATLHAPVMTEGLANCDRCGEPPDDTIHTATAELTPAERAALTMARALIARGGTPPVNTTAVLVAALDRLTAPPEEDTP
jgi:hypothetical protein